MAIPGIELIQALRVAAKKLEKGAAYQWGHMGACNCGNLAQELLKVSKAEIHAWALETREGDWSEQTDEYCPTSNLPMDLLIRKLLDKGLSKLDLKHLETLSDPEVLRALPEEERTLNYNYKGDAIKYMLTLSNILEDKLLEEIDITSLEVSEPEIEVYHI